MPQKLSLNEYLEKVSRLKGTKTKMGNPAARASYEQQSIEKGYWLSVTEFEEAISKHTKLLSKKK